MSKDTTQSPDIIRMSAIRKSFPGVLALSDVDFSLRRGEIHALMGENGAGKSTLIKVLTGVQRRDGGDILFEDKSIDFAAPYEAPRAGISTVYQEVNLAPNLSVAENLFLGRQPMRFGSIDWKTLKQRSNEALARLDLNLDTGRLLSSYPIAIQQMVAIARAIDIKARVLILDEPTSSLDAIEVRRLFKVMHKLKSEGIAIIFVTHFLDQVYEMSDRITVLRNGQFVGTWETTELPQVELIGKMMGKAIADLSGINARQMIQTHSDDKNHFLVAEGVGRSGLVKPIDLKIADGEVLGLAGLLGSGRTEVAQLIFGIQKSDSGLFKLNGKERSINNPRQAVAAGIAFCPEDRKSDAIIGDLTIRENIILALQASKGIFRYYSRKKQQELADSYIKLLNIVTPSAAQKIRNLSGGNQQKVILARWLASNPKLLILDEPTRGIDVGAKAEIQKTILSLAAKGMSILFISAELSEIVRCCTRVAIMRDRSKINELSGAAISEHAIMEAIAAGGNAKTNKSINGNVKGARAS